ncbi:unnamed protein product [Paramecium primaurelia]|uniref:RING-type domain-containing protein n=1 Tax=Paramecium primaurelia TaxID=5886 RepID=A0A8S1MA08_PARPR|nr:unnamed protein product [Paramecium primaurelia]
MLILFYFLVLTKQQRDVDFDDNYYWTLIDELSDNNIYKIKNLSQPYYYVQVTLFQEDLSFILIYDLNQIPKVNTSRGDYISYYEKRKTRFLKIEPNGKIIYITTHSKNNKGKYNITIWGSKMDYCDNSCSNNGECYDDGCDCYSGYIGSDCHQTALEIQEEHNEIYFYGDETQFFYLNINNWDEMDIQLKFSTNSYQGIEITLQLTDAIIIPSQIKLNNEDSYIKQYKVYDTQPQELIFYSMGPSKKDFNIVFAARPINGHLNTIVSTLSIELTQYGEQENTFSIIVIIIIVVAISAAVIIIIILFFVCKNIRKRKMLRLQVRLRMARLEGQQPVQNTQQQDQENLFDFLTPIQIQESNNQDNCAICLENLNNNQEVRQTHCHHNFHSICIKEWIQKNKKECPVCRSNLAIKDVDTHPKPSN